MEQEIRNADLSDMMCDLLYLLGCGVNEKMPAKAYIKTFQEAYDEDKMQMMYRFSKAHFVEALTGTVLKKAGVKLPAEWEQSIAKAIRKVSYSIGNVQRFFLIWMSRESGICH